MTYALMTIVIGVLIWHIATLRNKLAAANAKVNEEREKYRNDLAAIRMEVESIQLAGVNLTRNLNILHEVGEILTELSELKGEVGEDNKVKLAWLIDKLKSCKERLC